MKVLVTGGGGFVGKAIVHELLARGHEVGSASRGAYPELEEQGVTTHRVDLADAATTTQALAGYEAVVHTAALAGVWGPRADYLRANVDGTRNVLAACTAHGIERLVYTSSPSVCFDGHGHRNAGNDLPRATRFLAAYPETKAIAERLVLEANGPTLATCALRPHLVFGPGDPHLIPRLLQRARSGRLAIVGDGSNEVGMTYVENAAVAHADALEALGPDAPHAGRAYFVTQRESVKLWDWIGRLLADLDIPPPRRRVSVGTARAAGTVLEGVWRALRLRSEPPMTRFVALQLATDHSYDPEPLRRDVGYRERVDMEQATERLVASLRAAPSPDESRTPAAAGGR